MFKITSITAQRILDSRGNWTLEALVTLSNGMGGKAAVPAGASVGKREAKIVPVDAAIKLIQSEIKDALVGRDVTDQTALDAVLIELDGTKNKSRLGGNTMLAVSLATCRAAAAAFHTSLYQYIDSLFEPRTTNYSLPTPLFNVLNGGRHANNDLDFQEFMIIPSGFPDFESQLVVGTQIYHQLERVLEEEGHSTELGDEGGFAPRRVSNLDALDLLSQAVRLAGFDLGKDISFGMDVAAGELEIPDEELHRLYLDIRANYPLRYLEDPFGEDDIGAWVALQSALPGTVSVVGDDLTATQASRIEEMAQAKAISGVVIKPNQVGTLTETLAAVEVAKQYNLDIVVSHRSGETSDTFIADLAVGVGAEYLKTGAPARGERVAKYNRLLEIEKEQMGLSI